jgi:hypothetical protein
MSASMDVVGLDETVLSHRRDTVALRRCKGCGWEGPAYLEWCRRCPAVLGERYERDILLVVPELAGGVLAAKVLPTAALALELSGQPFHVDRLRAEAGVLLGRLLAAFPEAAVLGTLPCGVLVALLSAGSLAESAAMAARGAAALDGSGCLEWRAGLAVGLVDGSGAWHAAVVERAARLARAAQPGQVLAGYGTARLLDHEWQFAPTGVLSRREEDAVDAVTTLVGHKQPASTPSALAADRGPSLVGRARELAVLDGELARVRSGEGRWCALIAPAGGGKSKLLRAWLGRHGGAAIRVIGAAASPFGQAPRALVDQLLDALAVPIASDVPAPQALAALADALERAAREEPLLVVIDDLHWADADSLALLRALGGRSFRGCLFVVALRSSFVASASWLLERAQRLELPPLDRSERDRLVHRLLPDESAAPLRSKLASAGQGGNPLYLEHAVAYLQEAGADVPLPRSLHEAVLSRLRIINARIYRRGYERPPPEELAAIEQTVGEWLDRLETGDYEDRGTIAEYLSLLENIDAGLVIAGSIAGVPQKRNRRLAAAVDRFYSASFPERAEAIERLAQHDAANAAYAAARGAQRAAASVRLVDATGFLELAQRLTNGEDRSRHLLELGDVLIARGEPEQASHAYAEAAHANPNDQFRARCECRLARTELARANPRAATRLLKWALPRLGEQERLAAACDLAYAQALLGDPARAHLTLSEAQAAPDTPELRSLLLRTSLRLAVLTGGTDVESIASECASSLVLEGDPVADLAALIDATLLLRCALPQRVGSSLIAEATRAAHRLGNAAADRELRTEPRHR